jgi:hypothetical protein
MLIALTVVASPGGAADDPAGGRPGAGRLCRVRLVGEAEPDTTSVDTILAGIIKPGMNDEEKCMAVYRYVSEHRFWYPAATPRERGRYMCDPVLMMNCYPAMICQADTGVTAGFWAGLGYDVRYWQLGGHTTGEVFYDGKWHNFDATLGRYKRDKDGSIGGVEVSQRQFKKESYVPPMDDYEIGHRMDFSLRRGETFTRYWHPLGKTAEFWRPGGREGIMPDERPGHNRGLQAIMKTKPYRVETDGLASRTGSGSSSPS